MVDITETVLTRLRDHTFTYPVTVREFYSTEKAVYPMITVDELGNRTIQTLQGGVETFSQVSFKVEIYAKHEVIQGTPVSNRTIVKTLGREVDEIMRTKLGMIRNVDPVTMVFTADKTVMRYIMTFTGKLDPLTGYIYQ